ncbi:STAS domain-containing protein [Streptomyces sp. KLOTTS4A1]|uniref:STAS domain-containing protein n=1 Tax=Streptomyces sp. KLOTTS4A1 TaxID=3390996 RepID=UPI0039F546D0
MVFPYVHGPTPVMRRDGTRLTVELHGELDIAGAQDIEEPLSGQLCLPTAELVLDLRLLTFLDCGGIALFDRLRRRLGREGATIVLVCTDPSVLRVLDCLRVPDSVPVLPTPPAPPAPPAPPHPRLRTRGGDDRGARDAS